VRTSLKFVPSWGYLALLPYAPFLEDQVVNGLLIFEEEFLQLGFCLMASWLKQVNFLLFIFMWLCFMVNFATLC
jgi:hypothetical protein